MLNRDKDWLVGFVDRAGCFSISFNIKNKFKSGIKVKPSFSISQFNDKLGYNKACLIDIKNFLNCGFIRFSKKNNTLKYECRNLNELRNNIVIHF